MAKKRKRLPDPNGDGLVDVFTLPELVSNRVIVLTYNPILDTVEVEGEGCSPLELRAIVAQAADQLLPIEQD